ncbi:non-canonical purine NTP pyrophosphatase [Streptomyces sp. OK228]|uniref:non-canonical purine NTP pyrophosphatase n=1 Tax=Streptomyces sp. OK228 TaxID=1882786 RepID=UPI0027BA3AD7|nr:non-canonical purine NTP pyrophosphatase [Streptomyces sp. OK228]
MSGITVAMCTGNAGKFRTAQEHLAPWGVEVEQVALELDEIQTKSVAKIAEHKARQAYAILGRPLFVEDSGFYIEEFGGWPGPMVKTGSGGFRPRRIHPSRGPHREADLPFRACRGLRGHRR